MNLQTKLAIVLASQLLMVNLAHAEAVADTTSQMAAIPQFKVEAHKWYDVQRGVNLASFDIDKNPRPLTLTENSEITVLEEDGDKVLIGIDDYEDQDPVLGWVSKYELEAYAMPREFKTNEREKSFADNDSDEDNIATQEARRHGGRGHRRGKMTYCLRDVRLTAARFTRAVPQGVPMASLAYPKYRAKGWKPVAFSPSNPPGTACFSGGGRSCGRRGCGHAAIKIGSNAWKGAGVRSSPWIAGRYKIGCLVPPGRG